MAKLTLSPISNLQNESTVVATINANNDLIEEALEITLSRDGTSPNTMTQPLDMNSQRIINLPEPVDDNDAVRLVDIGDAPGHAEDAEASADAAAASETAAAASAASAASSASSASSSASAASSSASAAAVSATTSSANASVVVGNEYAFDTTTSMADPGTGDIRLDNATVASATNIAISALTNDSGNPNIRTFIAAWDDSTNTNRGTIYIRELGSPANFAVFTISGALTDNTTWLQIPVTYVTGNGSFSAADRISVQFARAGDKGSDGLIAGSTGVTDNRVLRADGTGGATVQNSAVTIDDSGNITGVAAITTSGGIELGHASDTTVSRSSAGVIAVEGVTVPLNSTSSVHTASTIELGHASDTTLSRSSAGVIAVEGVTVPLNSTSSTHTASTIELGHASDTTISRSSAGVIAVEGVTVPLNSTSSTHTANTIELGHASDTTISRASAGLIQVEGNTVVMLGTTSAFTAAQSFSLAQITDGANLDWTVNTKQKAYVNLAGNRTMNATTGAVAGTTYFLWVIQDGTGSRTISWTTSGSGSFDFGTSGAPTLTTTANKADLLTFEAVSLGGTLKLRFTGIAKGFT